MLSISEISNELSVSVSTISNWIKSGVLPRLIQNDNFYKTVAKKRILFKYKLKYFDNITANDLKLLENAISQKTIEVTRLNYIDAKS